MRYVMLEIRSGLDVNIKKLFTLNESYKESKVDKKN